MELEIVWEEKEKFLPRKEEIQKEINKIENENKEIKEYNKHVSKCKNILVNFMFWFSYMWPMIVSLISIGLIFFLLPQFLTNQNKILIELIFVSEKSPTSISRG